MIDNFADFDTVLMIEPTTLSATTTSSPVDLSEYNSVTVLWEVGVDAALTGANFWTLTLTESDVVGSGYTTVVAADIVDGTDSPTASVVVDSTTEDSLSYKLGYIGNARFLKAVLTETGTVSGNHNISAILGRKRMGPTAQVSNAVAS